MRALSGRPCANLAREGRANGLRLGAASEGLTPGQV